MAKRIYFLFICLFLSVASRAQIEFKAQTNSEKIGINEILQINFVMNQEGDNFQKPHLGDFREVGGPMVSVSNSWINGVKSFQKSYTFYYEPKRKGIFTIGSATIEIDGKKYKTEEFEIQVTDAVEHKQQTQQQAHRSPWASFFEEEEPTRQAPQLPNPVDASRGVFVEAELSSTSPYINQPVNLVYRLYVGKETGVMAIQLKNMPKFENFWNYSEEQRNAQQPKEVLYKGKNYRMIELKRVILLPQQAGNISIEPLELDVMVEDFTGHYDFFGYPEITRSEKRIATKKQVVEVKALPLQNQPEDFLGAVGIFDFSVKVNKASVEANEAIELEVKVNGAGNLQLLSLPKPEVSSDFELYDPQRIESITKDLSKGMQGSVAQKYVIIPQYKGKYTIPPIKFSYFDLVTKSYKTLQSSPLTIDVLTGDEKSTNSLKAEVNQTKEIFNQIKTSANFKAVKSSKGFYDSLWFYLLLLHPLVVIPLGVFLARKRAHYISDVSGVATRNNQRLVKRYLKQAKDKIGTSELFYTSLERCLHNFLKAKLKMETSEMSMNHIGKMLVENGVSQEIVEEFSQLKARCEMARYSPFDVQSMHTDFSLALTVISRLEKHFKA